MDHGDPEEEPFLVVYIYLQLMVAYLTFRVKYC
jgi:hypothetical protein